MFKYVWTAKDKFGTSVVRDLTANTIEESKAVLSGAATPAKHPVPLV